MFVEFQSTMNHTLATYIDFVQSLAVVLIIGFAAYSLKQILVKVEKKIVKAEIKIEE